MCHAIFVSSKVENPWGIIMMSIQINASLSVLSDFGEDIFLLSTDVKMEESECVVPITRL